MQQFFAAENQKKIFVAAKNFKINFQPGKINKISTFRENYLVKYRPLDLSYDP